MITASNDRSRARASPKNPPDFCRGVALATRERRIDNNATKARQRDFSDSAKEAFASIERMHASLASRRPSSPPAEKIEGSKGVSVGSSTTVERQTPSCPLPPPPTARGASAEDELNDESGDDFSLHSRESDASGSSFADRDLERSLSCSANRRPSSANRRRSSLCSIESVDESGEEYEHRRPSLSMHRTRSESSLSFHRRMSDSFDLSVPDRDLLERSSSCSAIRRPSSASANNFFAHRRRSSLCNILTTEAHDFDDGEPTGTTDGSPSRVLIVDDSRINRLLLKRHVEKLGHETVTATDGQEALDILSDRGSDVDLVLLDIFMPTLNGDEVLQRMMAPQSALRHIPVIMISASEDMNQIIRCIEMGAADYLPKPFDPVLFRARVRSCLQTKRLRDLEATYLRQIEWERNRVDKLLGLIFPEKIAHELKTTQAVQPRRYEGVAVLFLDIVGFTSYCNGRTPEEVVGNLKTVFERFEEVAERHGVDKIKTIGDCFMATSGLLRDIANPVRNAVACAFEMIEVSKAVGARWDVRVGIHIGPVVAGVVGRRHSLFDIWGDTVNTAARVESNGVAGGVTVSDDALVPILGECEFKSLGEVEAKGKGMLSLHQIVKLKTPSRGGGEHAS